MIVHCRGLFFAFQAAFYLSFSFGQSFDTQGELENGIKNKNWPIAGEHYSNLLQNGPSASIYLGLGNLFMEDSYPKHASFYYELAIALEPENPAIKEAFKKASERIEHLEKRFHEFSEKAGSENDPTYYGRLSAIRFYMGERREGLKILKAALQTYNNDARIMPLAGVFQKQLSFEGESVRELYEEFQKAISAGDLNSALVCLGQINYISIGHQQVENLLDMVLKAFPGKLNQESDLLLREFVKQFNQVDIQEGGNQ